MNTPEHRSAEDRAVAAIAALGFAVGAPVAYAAQRIFERLRSGASDPALILRTSHSAFIWRTVIAMWCGGLVALSVHRLARRAVAEPRPWAAWWMVGALLAVAIVAVILP
ncbi:MAG: hypothetical protein KC731_24975 [Myxococcales bacterium]|nr:hypothetical protein [Myxococcales bacterium]